MEKILRLILIVSWISIISPCHAENFVVKGDMASTIHYELRHQITTGDAMRKLSLSFVVPQDFESPTYRQRITDFKISFSPDPQDMSPSRDVRGNKLVLATWTKFPDKIDAVVSFDATNQTGLKLIETKSPYPLVADTSWNGRLFKSDRSGAVQ